MRICNNKDGMPDCCGRCYDNGLCLNKYKCEDSIAVNEKLIKQLMDESGRNKEIMDRFIEMVKIFKEFDNECNE